MSAQSQQVSPQETLANARFVEQMRSRRHRHEVVGKWSLTPVGRRPSLLAYIRALHHRRHFIWTDARSRAFSGSHGMLLGNVWLVVRPLLDGFTYYIIFGFLLQTSRGIEKFLGYLLIGIFLFQYTGRSLSNGASAVTGGRNMIRAFNFPRASLPISVVLREAFGMLPVLATMTVMILAFPPHAQVTWRWALFPAIFALQTVFNLGVAFFAARVTARIPDLKNLISFFSRFWMYGSAVMFSFDRFVDHPGVLAALELNPAFIILDMSRDVLLYATTPAVTSWATLAAWAFGTAVLGFLFFWRAEERYGRE
jgi:teichoic acid transport system permease protein